MLGSGLGHTDYVAASVESTLKGHRVLLDHISRVPTLQSPQLLLVHCCAAAGATEQLRVIQLDAVRRVAEGRDLGLWRCVSLGGLGLRSAVRTV